jgi:lipopolysaccharide export system permease protein
MKVLQRYFISEIVKSVAFVLVAFLALFSFLDLIGELQSVGRGNYRLQHAFLFILLSFPGYIYELMPVAVLIGAINTLAQFAARSEYTIMRASSMSTLMAAGMLAKIGVLFVILTFLVGEGLAPVTSRMAAQFKMNAQGTNVSSGGFHTGMWSKDVIRDANGGVAGSRFMNVATMRPNGELNNIRVFEFDNDLRLTKQVRAERAHYLGNSTWRLESVSESVIDRPGGVVQPFLEANAVIKSRKMDSMDLASEITPNILSVLAVDPDKMSAYNIYLYMRHLAENNQDIARHRISFWKKTIYPFSIFVMMALALPFAYLHFRSGGVSLKIFSGIMLGVSFILINNLFSHLGLLNTWPAFLTAILPSTLFLISAIAAIWWVERH